jgi:hypothetical protein
VQWRAGSAYCHSVDAFAWGVIGSVAGVVGAAAAVVFGLLPLLRDRQARREIAPVPAAAEAPVAGGGDDDVPVVVGEVPQEPVAFQPRAGLLAGLDGQGPSGRVAV